jgi:hypothetical protein
MATHLWTSMDIHLARRFMELPLAPNFPVLHVRRIRLTARWSETWAVGCVRAVGSSIARFRDVGTRKGNGALHCYRIRSPHERRYRLGVWVQAGDWASRRWALGFNWVWSVVWSVGWGTMIIDAWTRRGLMASDFFPVRASAR